MKANFYLGHVAMGNGKCSQQNKVTVGTAQYFNETDYLAQC